MNTISTLTHCPICSKPLAGKLIDYIDKNDGHFLIIRDVPVQECESGHQFFHTSVAKKIERLFEMERKHLLTPTTTIAVPVIELDIAA